MKYDDIVMCLILVWAAGFFVALWRDLNIESPPKRPGVLLRRVSDGALFKPGFPPWERLIMDWNGRPRQFLSAWWYGRRVEAVPRRWWHLRERWRYTGEVWYCFNAHELEVVHG